MIKAEHYTYRVQWSEEDQEHVALCTEFPSLSFLAKKPETALKGLIKLVFDIIKDMESNHEEIPEPLSSKHFSGKFMVRIPPEQHRNLAIEAAQQGVSLNRYVSSRLVG